MNIPVYPVDTDIPDAEMQPYFVDWVDVSRETTWKNDIPLMGNFDTSRIVTLRDVCCSKSEVNELYFPNLQYIRGFWNDAAIYAPISLLDNLLISNLLKACTRFRNDQIDANPYHYGPNLENIKSSPIYKTMVKFTQMFDRIDVSCHYYHGFTKYDWSILRKRTNKAIFKICVSYNDVLYREIVAVS